jgi:hypothetical protein
MSITINDRDVVSATLVEATLERPIRSIHFELNESFTFGDAFDSMVIMRQALGEVRENETEELAQPELDLVFPDVASAVAEEPSNEEPSNEEPSNEEPSNEEIKN